MKEPNTNVNHDNSGRNHCIRHAVERNQRCANGEERDIDRAEKILADDLSVGSRSLKTGVMLLAGSNALRDLSRGKPLELLHPIAPSSSLTGLAR